MHLEIKTSWSVEEVLQEMKQGLLFPSQGSGLHPGWASGPQTFASWNLWDPTGGSDRAAAGNPQREHLAGEPLQLELGQLLIKVLFLDNNFCLKINTLSQPTALMDESGWKFSLLGSKISSID